MITHHIRVAHGLHQLPPHVVRPRGEAAVQGGGRHAEERRNTLYGAENVVKVIMETDTR